MWPELSRKLKIAAIAGGTALLCILAPSRLQDCCSRQRPLEQIVAVQEEKASFKWLEGNEQGTYSGIEVNTGRMNWQGCEKAYLLIPQTNQSLPIIRGQSEYKIMFTLPCSKQDISVHAIGVYNDGTAAQLLQIQDGERQENLVHEQKEQSIQIGQHQLFTLIPGKEHDLWKGFCYLIGDSKELHRHAPAVLLIPELELLVNIGADAETVLFYFTEPRRISSPMRVYVISTKEGKVIYSATFRQNHPASKPFK